MLQVKFKKISSNTKLPFKGSLDAACSDVYAHSITFEDGKMVIGLGFKTEIPKGHRGVIVPRSNLTKHVLIPPYEIGERCAQIYFEPVLETEFVLTKDLEDTKRGTGGFGSTGLN